MKSALRLALSSSCFLLMFLQPYTAQASCGTTTCSMNTDWSEHGIPQEGWSLDLRYSYSKADNLKSGNNSIAVDPTDPAYQGVEVENQRTINRLVTTSLDYNSSQDWGVMLQIPYIMRDHTHLIGGTNPANISNESFNADDFGDMKVIGRYRWKMDDSGFTSSGIKLGLKLPTGRRDFQKKDAAGANAGVPDEVSLQPGNGSTDMIAGVFWNHNAPGSDFSWFVQGSAQSSIDSLSDYRPGNQYNLDIGTRYAFSHDLSGLMQLNAQWNNSDSGSKASISPVTGEVSSGGILYALSPGLSYALGSSTQLYGVVQLPLYHFVNGEQLTANYSLAAGLSQHF